MNSDDCVRSCAPLDPAGSSISSGSAPMSNLGATIARSAVLVGAIVVVDLLAMTSNLARGASGLLRGR
jgi:hypothetical protein